MKIGIFTDSYLPYTSGVVRSIQTFSEELTKKGHEVFIFAPSYRDCSEEKRVFRFLSLASPTNRDFSVPVPISIKLKPTIKKLNLDLIHVHSPFILGRVGAKYARKLEVPLVFTYHTLYDQYTHYVPFAQSLTKDLAQRISKDFCNHCDLVIVPTDAVEKYLRDINVEASISVVPTGIKLSDFQNGDSKWLSHRFNLPENEKILLFVGRLGREKNIVFLLECFGKINEEVKNTRLVLVGGGPEEGELRNKTKELGLEEKVTFTGVLTPDEVVHCYVAADVFVFPSITETQGIVIGEAKAAGLPVVAVAAFGVSNMVEDGVDGFLTELVPGQFIEKVILLLKNHGLREKMSCDARQNAEKLSTGNCTTKLIACYNQAISENSPGTKN